MARCDVDLETNVANDHTREPVGRDVRYLTFIFARVRTLSVVKDIDLNCRTTLGRGVERLQETII